MYQDETLPASARAAGKGSEAFAIGTLAAGRYRIVRFIAAGGMGAVFEADDRILGTRVALKSLKASGAMSGKAVKRLVREIALARKVTHPHVCRLHDVGEHEGRVFLTMELLEGETLAARLQRGPLDLATFERIAGQLIEGLEALHEADIIHRDFKSANVIVTGARDHERAVITDFGLARTAAFDVGSTLTGDGALLGTPAYMAPEQVEGRVATPASDLYALGIVLFEMATGTLPFAADAPMAVATARLTHEAPRASTRRLDLGARWDAAIARCLERDPRRRPPTARAILPGSRPGRRGAVWIAGAVGATALAAVASSIVRWDRRPAGVPQPAACPGAARKLVGVWDADTRARAAARFATVGQAFVDDAWRSHAAQLDLQTATWATLWDQACASPDRDADPLRYGQRLACLDERLAELRALAGVLGNPSVDVELFAISSIGNFPLVPPATCTHPEVLRALGPVPPAAARPALDALMTELHRLRFQARTGFNSGREVDVDTVSAKLGDLERQAEALDAPAVAGQIAYWHGVVILSLGRSAEAAAQAAKLIALAEDAHSDPLLVLGLTLDALIRTEAPPPYASAAVEALLGRADRLAARLGDPADLVQSILEVRELHLRRLGRYDEYVAAAQREVALDLELGSPANALMTRTGLARIRAWWGELDGAVAEARAVLDDRAAWSGAASVPLAGELGVLAPVFAAAGDPRTALDLEERALSLYERAWRERPATYADWTHQLAAGFAGRLGDQVALDRHLRAAVRAVVVAGGERELVAWVNLARDLRYGGYREAAARALVLAAAVRGRDDDAAAIEDERRELAAETGAPVVGLRAPQRAAVMRARVQLQRGRAAQAAAALARLAAGVGSAPGWSAHDRGEVEAWRGIALLAAGDPAGAIDHLEPAFWTFGRCCLAGSVIAQETRVALARALWATGQDRARARMLATRAEAALAAMGPDLAAKARDAAAWLTTHPAPATVP